MDEGNSQRTSVGKCSRSTRGNFFYRDLLLRGSGLKIDGIVTSQPHNGVFKTSKGADVPAMQRSNEGKQPGPLMWVTGVKNGKPVLLGETNFPEGIHQLDEIRRCEDRRRSILKSPEIEERLVDAALPARARQPGENRPAPFEVEAALRSQTNEFAGPDDLEF